VEPELKAEGEVVLSAVGFSTTAAVTLFFRQVVMHRGLPFEAKIPNDETLKAFKEAKESPEKFLRYSNAKVAMDDMWGE